jgi:CBS domain-containing protein
MTIGESEFEEAYSDDEDVRGAMTRGPIRLLEPATPICVAPTSPISEAIAAMNEAHAGCVLVVEQGRLRGILTERDVLAKVVGRLDLDQPVEAAMTPDPETVGPDDAIAYALQRMHVGGYRNVPVVDRDGAPVGLISVRDFVEFIVAMLPGRAVNVPPEPRLEAHELDGG